MLACLHYLPVEFRIKYKTLVITYQEVLKGEVPEHISGVFGLVSKYMEQLKGDHAFAVLPPK